MNDDPNVNKAQMIALLALLDVLVGKAEMTAVGADKVGPLDSYGRAGQLRLRFTVFGDETRMLALAHDLTLAGSQRELVRQVMARVNRDDKLRFVARMIEAWTEVMQRLLAPELAGASAGQLPVLADAARRLKP